MSNCFEKPYRFQTTTAQMTILFQFNEQTSLTIQQLMDYTGIEGIIPMIQGLVANNLLTSEDEYIGLTSVINLNHLFASEKLRINISGVLKTDTKKEKERSLLAIEKDRVSLIDASIVRIMKQRKIMSHVDLMAETLGQLICRFQPKVLTIKKRIDWLIEREYIERLEGEPSSYQYLA